ncbi:TPT-domain-containing protein [Saccharata proteae CBS 121410]|uniref:TPT-domain-containing protein n=1 Tax=Saccharata proteae CBS 121410 TaxID=1314787 RepID=A0A9P4LUD9_9PEZI|nr:TPT-domain-containing protein [Saccharata proteae CBS 121410]
MASSSRPGGEALSPASASSPRTFKFPPFSPDILPPHPDEGIGGIGISVRRSPSPNVNGTALPADRWQPRKTDSGRWGNGSVPTAGGNRHNRQKSLSEAFSTIRTRRGSVSANAHELADALKAPVSMKIIMLCGFWYATSILSNTSSKAILTAFPKPVTLTLIQFAFVCSWCLLLAWLAKLYPSLKVRIPALRYGIRPPTRDLILTTLPLTMFQIGGHILSSDAMSRIPVSLVHTIKGLSPLVTVLAYRFYFHINYSVSTYLSLIPLTLGVIMACSANFSGNFIGLLCALGSALLFVTQNIVSKKLFNEAEQAEQDNAPARNRKPDKLNLLCYSSGLAFLITAPLWLFSEGIGIIGDFLYDASIDLQVRPGSLDHGRLALEYIFNGSFHFGQNLVAFVLLSMVSPVTYSVASLIKRVFVIVFAIVWYGNKMTGVQAVGIALTFLGLYLYDRTRDNKADRKAKLLQTLPGAKNESLLPLSSLDKLSDRPVAGTPPQLSSLSLQMPNGDVKKSDDVGPGRPRRESGAVWLPPGTRQEDTWRPGDVAPSGQPQQQGVRVG